MRFTVSVILAIGIIAILLAAGCADISVKKQVGDFGATFGTSSEEQKAIDWFIKTYGDPRTNNGQPPRFIEPLITTGVTDKNMPVDKVAEFPVSGGSVFFWVIYDNFKKGDKIDITWTYLENGNVVTTVSQQAGDDFGRFIAEFQKPGSGWGKGRQKITVSGFGTSADVTFTIGDVLKTVPLPYEPGGVAGPATITNKPTKIISIPPTATGEGGGGILGKSNTRDLSHSGSPVVSTHTTVTPGPTCTGGSWAGTWDTSYGIMRLTQNGNLVDGTYDYTDPLARVHGAVSGNTFTGTWSEPESYLPPDNAGDLIMTLSGDGTTFSGEWRSGSTGDWAGWDGTRTSCTGNCFISAIANPSQASWGDTISFSGSAEGGCTQTITFKLIEGPGIPANGILIGTTTPTSARSYQFDWNTGTTKQQYSLADGNYRISVTSEPDGQYTRLGVLISSKTPSFTITCRDVVGGTRNVNCAGSCKNLNQDPDNCGSCGHKCGPKELCMKGNCVPLLTTTVPTRTEPWEGMWDTTYGIMRLIQTGNHVNGWYDNTDPQSLVDCTVSGNTCTGYWSEPPTYLPPDHGGDLILTLSGDGTTFSGEWRYGSTGGLSGGWDGTRTSP